MSGFIAPATLEQVRAASDIVDVVGSYVTLKRAGANFTALCPFHREKTPSFNVNPHKQIFHCFGCHKGGDVFTFVKEYENIDFPDAVRRLAERAHIPLEFDNQPGQGQARHIKDQLLQIHEQIALRWQMALAGDAAAQIARDYLAKRGVAAEAVKLFRIGYAPDAWDDTVNWAKSKHYDLAVVEQAGLIIRKEGSDRHYDRFRGRLMFPICDEQGRVVAFSGRVLAGDEKTAKYVNSPETPIFTKGKTLFALDKAKKAILDLGFVVVCEGQLDTIACHMGDVPNVVAPQGTALTSAHARILRRFTDDIILCFDGDAAGQRAAARAFDDLLAAGAPFRVASIPPPDDPDSYIKKFGRDAFVKLLVNADGFHDFHLKYLCAQHDPASDRGRQAVVEAMATALRKTGDSVLLDTYAQKTALRLGVAADSVRAAFNRPGRATVAADREDDAPEPAARMARPSENEAWLLRLALENEEFADWIAAHLELDWLTHAAVREMLSRRLAARADDSWPGLAAWVSQIEPPEWKNLVTEILADGRPVADPESILKGSGAREGALKILRDKFIDRQLAALNQKLAAPDLADSEQAALLTQMQRLRQQKREPLSALGEA